ncbi:MAG: hypothetical protein HQL67_11160 [Magnetococcales bacterium]|nr:hypothetical protein [Magnetococcales bacterium]
MSDRILIDAILELILRQDGSLRYDRMRQGDLEALLPSEIWNDTGMETVLHLTTQGVFHPLREPLGNIGTSLFSLSRDRVSEAMNGVGIFNSNLSDPLIQALGITLSDLEKREPRALEAELLVQDPEGNAILLRDMLELEIRCNAAGKKTKEQEACRHLYWQLWEFAWARRIFIAEDHVIEALENIYTRYPFLDTRQGPRRAPLPPGNLPDPRFEEECEPELW